MPLYEYECEACHHRFEVIQKFSDPPKETCPKCGSPVHKLQSAPAFQFKGTGWYVTDYAKKDQGGSSKSGGGDSSSSEAKSSASSSEKTDKSEKGEKTDKGTDNAKPAASSDSGTTSGAAPPKTA
jgi:putative FmdB family regulatory protein